MLARFTVIVSTEVAPLAFRSDHCAERTLGDTAESRWNYCKRFERDESRRRVGEARFRACDLASAGTANSFFILIRAR